MKINPHSILTTKELVDLLELPGSIINAKNVCWYFKDTTNLYVIKSSIVLKKKMQSDQHRHKKLQHKQQLNLVVSKDVGYLLPPNQKTATQAQAMTVQYHRRCLTRRVVDLA